MAWSPSPEAAVRSLYTRRAPPLPVRGPCGPPGRARTRGRGAGHEGQAAVGPLGQGFPRLLPSARKPRGPGAPTGPVYLPARTQTQRQAGARCCTHLFTFKQARFRWANRNTNRNTITDSKGASFSREPAPTGENRGPQEPFNCQATVNKSKV